MFSFEEQGYYLIELPSGRSLYIRGMRGREQNLLVDPKIKPEDRLEILLKNCCLNPDGSAIDPSAMYYGDRVFALFRIRQLTYGDDLTVQVTCQNCRNVFKHTIHLPDLNEKKKETDEDTYELELPISKKKVKLHLRTGADERRLVMLLKSHPNKLITLSIFVQTDEIDGRRPKIDDFDDLPAKDIQFLRKEIEKREFGLETDVLVSCPFCFSEFTVPIPIGVDFFYPNLEEEEI